MPIVKGRKKKKRKIGVWGCSFRKVGGRGGSKGGKTQSLRSPLSHHLHLCIAGTHIPAHSFFFSTFFKCFCSSHEAAHSLEWAAQCVTNAPRASEIFFTACFGMFVVRLPCGKRASSTCVWSAINN